MKLSRLLPVLGLALGACSSSGHELAACQGPVWSANPSSPQPGVWDDGISTFFRFPGNMRIPVIYVVNPDGKEAVAPSSMDSTTRIVTVHQLAPEFRLRDGDSVLCLQNHHYDPIGRVADTGTTRPDVVRVLR